MSLRWRAVFRTNISFAVLGKEVKKYMDSGSFVPDDTMISLIGDEIESVADRNWLLDGEWKEMVLALLRPRSSSRSRESAAYVLNMSNTLAGFPRTLTQAERLQKLHPINLVLNLVVPTAVILDRVKSRWVHLPSGRVYNIGFNDPRVPVISATNAYLFSF